MTSTRHPSYLELDRYSLSSVHDATLARHVDTCAQCRVHLTSVARASSVPAWVSELGAPAVRRGSPRLRSVPVALFAGALAAAAALLVFQQPARDVSESAYDTSKGAPSVWVHVQHQGVRSPWDGAPLSPGDQVRLEVAPEEFTHVTVFSIDAHGARPTLLFRGALQPHVRVALDKAWQLDHQPEAERLTVLFARIELSVAAAQQALRERDPALVHAVELTLSKRSAP
jgi:hypothetical protein